MTDATDIRFPSKAVNQGRHGMDVRGDDLYPTPAPLTEALLRSGEHIPEHIWEPAAGLGHISYPLKEAGHKVYCSDIRNYNKYRWSQLDFLYQSGLINSHVTAIITNPPFSLSAEFVRHGLTLCDTVIILNRLAFLEGRARADIIDVNLARVYPFVERPRHMHRWSQGEDGVWREWQGKKAGSAMPVAWFVFKKNHDARVSGTQLKRLSWRNP